MKITSGIAGVLACLLLAGCRSGDARRVTSFVDKASPGVVRVLTWNIGRDSIFVDGNPASPTRPERFARVIRALQPDVLCLQEVWKGGQRAAALMDDILPLPEARTWRHHSFLDSAIVVRFDLLERSEGSILMNEPRPGASNERRRGHSMALVDLAGETDLYVICAHFQGRGGSENVRMRQLQSDLILTSLQEMRGAERLRTGTPIVILGDLNVISTEPPHFLEDLRAGRLSGNPALEGPDWDGSELEDAHPQQNATESARWTWNSDGGPFPPSALDRILYTGSVLYAEHSFVLNTWAMSEEELRITGLQREDLMYHPEEGIHDHLPVVVDFRILPKP